MDKFEQALNRMQVFREKGSDQKALELMNKTEESALERDRTDVLLEVVMQRSLLRMHQHWRVGSSNQNYLMRYHADIFAGLELANRRYPQLADKRMALLRRMGDYYYEVGEHARSVDFYKQAVDELKKPTNREKAEYYAPLGRAYCLSGNPAEGFNLLVSARRAVTALLGPKNTEPLPTWHKHIIQSGVLLKYAEGLWEVKNDAKQALKAAGEIVYQLEAEGYPARLIEYRRLKHKLNAN